MALVLGVFCPLVASLCHRGVQGSPVDHRYTPTMAASLKGPSAEQSKNKTTMQAAQITRCPSPYKHGCHISF
jgi:hypothetical protein